jgi:hypothetical protein
MVGSYEDLERSSRPVESNCGAKIVLRRVVQYQFDSKKTSSMLEKIDRRRKNRSGMKQSETTTTTTNSATARQHDSVRESERRE